MAALTTLENVKGWLGLSDEDVADDALLTRLITAVSATVSSYLDRAVQTATYTAEKYTVHCGDKFMPNQWPITAVTTLVVDGETIAASVDGEDGYLFDEQFIYLIGSGFSGCTPQNVSLTYVAGYAANSAQLAEIEQAVIVMISLRYKERERIGQRSKVLAGETVSYMITDMPPDVKAVLDKYRRFSL